MDSIVAFAQFIPAFVWALIAVLSASVWGIMFFPRIFSFSAYDASHTIAQSAFVVGLIAMIMLVIR